MVLSLPSGYQTHIGAWSYVEIPIFPHNPEPLPEHLGDLSAAVVDHGANVGLVVDPDVDRLAMIDERGQFFGEEYTIVAVADYILSKTPGNTVSNLSSSRALRDVTEKYRVIQ